MACYGHNDGDQHLVPGAVTEEDQGGGGGGGGGAYRTNYRIIPFLVTNVINDVIFENTKVIM